MAQPFLEFVHPQDRKMTLMEMNTLMSGVPIAISRTATAARMGRIVGWPGPQHRFPMKAFLYAIARDITERKQSEETLRLQSRREQALNRVLQAIRHSLELNAIFSKARSRNRTPFRCSAGGHSRVPRARSPVGLRGRARNGSPECAWLSPRI